MFFIFRKLKRVNVKIKNKNLFILRYVYILYVLIVFRRIFDKKFWEIMFGCM